MKTVVLHYRAVVLFHFGADAVRLHAPCHHREGAPVMQEFYFASKSRSSQGVLVEQQLPDGCMGPCSLLPPALQRGQRVSSANLERRFAVTEERRLEPGGWRFPTNIWRDRNPGGWSSARPAPDLLRNSRPLCPDPLDRGVNCIGTGRAQLAQRECDFSGPTLFANPGGHKKLVYVDRHNRCFALIRVRENAQAGPDGMARPFERVGAERIHVKHPVRVSDGCARRDAKEVFVFPSRISADGTRCDASGRLRDFGRNIKVPACDNCPDPPTRRRLERLRGHRLPEWIVQLAIYRECQNGEKSERQHVMTGPRIRSAISMQIGEFEGPPRW